jgi:hypothetical protein
MIDPDRKAEYDKAVAAQHEAIVEARKAELPDPQIEGYDVTEPGQSPVVVGSAEHVRILNSYPNMTSYADDINMVPPPKRPAPVNVDVPFVMIENGVLSCTMGNWDGEPDTYKYQWKIDGTNAGTDAATYTPVGADSGKTATCVVSATNEGGTTEAPPSNGVVIPTLVNTKAETKPDAKPDTKVEHKGDKR